MLGFFKTFAEKCAKARQAVTRSVAAVFSKPSLSADDWESLEKSLYEADFGVDATEYLLKRIREASKANKEIGGLALLRKILTELLRGSEGNPLLLDESTAPVSPKVGSLPATKRGREHSSEEKGNASFWTLEHTTDPLKNDAAPHISNPFETKEKHSSNKNTYSALPESSNIEAVGLQVVLLLGINGAGKTTTAAKLAHYWQKNGRRVLLGSCDTFRAAADQQLKTWAERLHLDCIGSQQRADAASVAYDVCQAGLHRGYQNVILDTAGRLHTKTSLTEELKKMVRVLKKCHPSFPQHRWLVIDGSLGTNSLQQAQLFHEAVGLTGLIVTKLDGTSKGGALVGIFKTLHIPIYFVGLGEKPEDLQPFSISSYVEALLGGEPQ